MCAPKGISNLSIREAKYHPWAGRPATAQFPSASARSNPPEGKGVRAESGDTGKRRIATAAYGMITLILPGPYRCQPRFHRAARRASARASWRRSQASQPP
jgi:hypothetical protein